MNYKCVIKERGKETIVTGVLEDTDTNILDKNTIRMHTPFRVNDISLVTPIMSAETFVSHIRVNFFLYKRRKSISGIDEPIVFDYEGIKTETTFSE